MCLLAMLVSGCQRGFLDAKPQKSLLVPTTATDLWALLDNNVVFNQTPGLTAIADGDLYTTDAGYKAYYTDEERKAYTWAPNIFGVNTQGDWDTPYQQVFYANTVLDRLDSAPEAFSDADRNILRGTALFHRALAFYNLAQEFTGIPLRLHADVTAAAGDATVKEVYDRVLSDLKTARQLLPQSTAYKTRPSVSSALAMLARASLAMEDYPAAGRYADSCLQRTGALIDYNTLSATAARPFPKALPNSNDEVLFYAVQLAYSFTGSLSPTVCDPALYQSYAGNDLRRTIFFKAMSPGFKFKGNYAGIISLFSGLATDEMYLVRAECAARSGNAAAAMADLNKLLVKRWKTGTFTPLSAATADDALRLVLTERRKELTGRNLRWSDLKRLNKDSRFAVTLMRTILGQAYTLAPGSAAYVYPLPADEK